MNIEQLKNINSKITANIAQVTSDFITTTMESIKTLVESLEEGLDYEGYVDLGEDPDNEGLALVGDLIRKEGLKYTLVLTQKVDDNDDLISENYKLMISVASCGE